ncbi:MAG: hypothetical protein Q4A27_02830 [bacterium]|nr:hypothetical protein [bacterium]
MINIFLQLILSLMRFFAWIPGVDSQITIYSIVAVATVAVIGLIERFFPNFVGRIINIGWLYFLLLLAGVALNCTTDWRMWSIGAFLILMAIWRAGMLDGRRGIEAKKSKWLRKLKKRIRDWLDEEVEEPKK